MADLKKKFIDILFEDDPEDKDIPEKIFSGKKKDQISAKEILYRKSGSSAFINLDETIRRDVTVEEVKDTIKEEYEMSSQISPIFGVLGDSKVASKKDTLKNQTKKENSHLDIVASPIYGNQYSDEEVKKDEIDVNEFEDEEEELHNLFDNEERVEESLNDVNSQGEEIHLFNLFGEDK